MLSTLNASDATLSWPAKAERIAEEIERHASVHDRDDTFVAEGFEALKREGFFAALVPGELGGGGASLAEMCEAIRIIASACGSTALAFSMHCHLVAVSAWRWKHQNAPTDALLKRVAAEHLILVSSGGSDWLNSGGTLVKVDGGYLVNARKPFASGSVIGDMLVTSAVYDDPEDGATVLHFAVPLNAEGVEHQPTWLVLGMRGTGSNDVVITDYFLPDSAVSGRRKAGPWHMLFHVISKMAFTFVYAAYLGVAERARSEAMRAAASRAPNVSTAQLAGELENELLSARLAHEQMVRLAEEAAPGPETTSSAMACRTLVGRHCIAAVTKAMELAGGGAFYRRNLIERAFRDVQAARFHPLQEKPQTEFSGKVALGWDIDG
ncbi:MAG TPA: acyl-CoA dehydrogenase family protein [Sphingomicrobium sp.]|nr:acyl-CoA dehydrogenase family protein [Sphingomicrobium sp.]